jgi:Mn2+/Fe2+ NRAMP family transporter
MYTLALYGVCVIITILVTSLAAIFNFVGAIASSSISFIVPYMFYFFLIKPKNKPKNIHYFLSLAGIIIFVPLGILSIVSLYI